MHLPYRVNNSLFYGKAYSFRLLHIHFNRLLFWVLKKRLPFLYLFCNSWCTNNYIIKDIYSCVINKLVNRQIYYLILWQIFGDDPVSANRCQEGVPLFWRARVQGQLLRENNSPERMDFPVQYEYTGDCEYQVLKLHSQECDFLKKCRFPKIWK